jgi:hypothetical protein
MCVNREITKLYVLCSCVPLICGIYQEDIESLKLMIEFLGKEISRNSCLIVTRCELINEDQRAKIRTELLEDQYFKEMAPFFQLGLFFSGALNRNDFNQGNNIVQLVIIEYN